MGAAVTEDPITMEICRHLLISVAEEMGLVMKRVAVSPMIREREDRSCAIFSADGALAAQAEHLPIHLALLITAVPRALDSLDRPLVRGDVLLFNDPYLGGSHLPDMVMIASAFGDNERLIGYAASVAHMTDVGGREPAVGGGATVTSILDEGLRLPPVRLYCGGELNVDILNLLTANVRRGDVLSGDLLAQSAAMRSGVAGLVKVARRFGTNETIRLMNGLIDYTERLTRTEIAKLPHGIAEASEFIDADPHSQPIEVRVRVAIQGDGILVDFAGSSAQRPLPVNVPLSVTRSAVYYVVRCLLDASIPTTAGCFRPVTVVTQPSTITHATSPAPVAGGSLITSQVIVDTIFRAVAQIAPEKAAAAGMGSHNTIGFGGVTDDGQEFVISESIGGGAGATAFTDGLDASRVNLMNSPNIPVEVLENEYPLRVRQYGIRRGTGGPGAQRGGDGTIRCYEFLYDTTVSILSNRAQFPARGLNGGATGAATDHLLIRADGRSEPVSSRATLTVKRGDQVIIRTAAGGGYGEPAKAASGSMENS